MKILSLNVRGFAVDGKFGWVRNICMKERPCIAVFQETKCKEVLDAWVYSLWGIQIVGIIKERRWRTTGNDSTIVNVYSPHNDRSKKLMWEYLDKLLESVNSKWLLCGDFNEVRTSSDRMNSQFHQCRADRFNDFIVRNSLIEIPLNGRKFTRISDDGVKFNKLDMFLVSNDFLSLWEDLSIVSLDRNLSDHCPLLLRDKVLDYGPRPFKVFDEWFNCEELDKIISEAWVQPIQGYRKDCVFRDRLKNVKLALKSWSLKNFCSLDSYK
ncbi:uncharacterized protein [Rutidosis leptorrhynchoides]|uniref:uncharacterized protein n=1 Tax=Rutidosis leptorrhynchoides TaxID=125765 RepID=UPI003A991633